MSLNQHGLRSFRILVLGENTFDEKYYQDLQESLEIEIVDLFDLPELLELLEQDSEFDLLFSTAQIGEESLENVATELFQGGYGYLPVCLLHEPDAKDLIEDCQAVGVKDFIALDQGIQPIKELIEKYYKFDDDEGVG